MQAHDAGQMDALIEGALAIEDGCTSIGSDGHVYGLVWPAGTTWQSEASTVTIADGTVLTAGLTIASAGGQQSLDDLRAYPDSLLGPDRLTEERTSCAEQWWVLGNEIDIVDSPSTATASIRSAIDDGCDRTVPSTSMPGEGHATVMTLVPSLGPLTFVVEAEPQSVCPGGQVLVTVRIHNSGEYDESAAPALLIGPIPHIVLDILDAVVVKAGGDAAVSGTVTVPVLPDGSYDIIVKGGSFDGATIDLHAP